MKRLLFMLLIPLVLLSGCDTYVKVEPNREGYTYTLNPDNIYYKTTNTTKIPTGIHYWAIDKDGKFYELTPAQYIKLNRAELP